MAFMASMASFALNRRQQDKDNGKSYSNGNNVNGKIWAYEAAQVTGSLKNVFVFSQWKSAWLSYEVSFTSALGIGSSESWKRLHLNQYAHNFILVVPALLKDVETSYLIGT